MERIPERWEGRTTSPYPVLHHISRPDFDSGMHRQFETPLPTLALALVITLNGTCALVLKSSHGGIVCNGFEDIALGYNPLALLIYRKV